MNSKDQQGTTRGENTTVKRCSIVPRSGSPTFPRDLPVRIATGCRRRKRASALGCRLGPPNHLRRSIYQECIKPLVCKSVEMDCRPTPKKVSRRYLDAPPPHTHLQIPLLPYILNRGYWHHLYALQVE